MAVYTPIDEDSLAAFLAGYDIGEPVALCGIQEGVENSNFRLETTRAASSSPSTRSGSIPRTCRSSSA